MRLLLATMLGLILSMISVAQTDITEIVKDCEGCPELVKIPAGSTYLGSYENEIGRRKGERVRTQVTIESDFLLSSKEVTLGQFRSFMNATQYQQKEAIWNGEVLMGCNYFDGKRYGYIARHNWQNPGYPQREDAPVVCVSWSDAVAYADWLSSLTGRKYRVPSSVEFEYAAKAGSDTPWFWGTDPDVACEYANVGDKSFAKLYPERPTFSCDDGFVYTAAVGSFKPNAYGLHDMIGNAWEWTNDCYHPDLTHAPIDGSSWEEQDNGNCDYRTPKGGSWISGISWGRSAVRSRDGAHYRSFMLGFRVAAEVEK